MAESNDGPLGQAEKGLEAVIARLEEQVTRLNTEAAKVPQLQAECDKLKAENESLSTKAGDSERVSELEAECDQLRSQIAQLREAETMAAKLPELEAERDKLKSELEGLRQNQTTQVVEAEEMAAVQAERDRLKQDLEELRGQYRDLETAFNDVKQKVESQSEEAAVEGSAAATGDDDANLQAQLEAERAQREKLSHDYDSLQRSFSVLKARYVQMQKNAGMPEPESLPGEGKDEGEEDRDSRVENLRIERDALNAELMAARKALAEEREQAGAIRADLEALRRVKQAVSSRLDETITRIESMSA